MNCYDKISKIKRYTDKVSFVYGTEDFSIYLYSLIKMKKPKTVLELGTGLGSIAIWGALAMQENGYGKLYTIDNGQDWEKIKKIDGLESIYMPEEYDGHIDNLIVKFDFCEEIQFYNTNIETVSFSEKIDILVSDYASGSYDICRLIASYLPKMEETSMIFIDSASTINSSYQTLERLIPILNQGKIPKIIRDLMSEYEIQIVETLLKKSTFNLYHLIENKDRTQNSTACIEINPIDVFPNSEEFVRF